MTFLPKKWCKPTFSYYPRCNVLMNNLSKSFNATILMARDKPIITMFEWIRQYIMDRFNIMREKHAQFTGEVMPKPRKRLDREVEMLGSWFPRWAGDLKVEVMHVMMVENFVVDLRTRTCTCNFW